MAAALAPVKLQLLSDTRHQLVADLAPAVATLAFKGLLGHYNFTVEEVDLCALGPEAVPPGGRSSCTL